MSAGHPAPLRVEQVLQLLPDVDAVTPLRAFVIAGSWMRRPSGPHQTVGKRYIQPADLREIVPQAVAAVAGQLTSLYEAAISAMEAEQRGDGVGAVRALETAGELEELAGRWRQAYAWYEHALRIAEGLRERQPEIGTLLRLADLETREDRHEEAARHFQRSLAIAEMERDRISAMRACQGLGETALAQAHWDGAGSWYARGLQYANGDRMLTGPLLLGEGRAALGRGDLDVAGDWLRRARELFVEFNDSAGLARTLQAWGRLCAARERRADALSAYAEALARLQRVPDAPALEVGIRLDICRLYLDWDRLADADDEVRRAEETAIVHHLTRLLARLYVVMGQVRARQHDDTGFVFYEKAIELCRGADPAPHLEAEVYRDYALYRVGLGELDEARGCLERAREILADVGDATALEDLDAEIDQLTSR